MILKPLADKIFFKSIWTATHSVYFFQPFHFFGTTTWTAPSLVNLIGCAPQNHIQGRCPRPYLLIVINYDFSMHDWAKLVSSSSTFTRTLRLTSKIEPPRSKNVSFHRTIFTRTTLHQTWSDLVLCSHMHNLCVISTMSTGEISGDISWLHPSATNQVNGPIDHKCNKDLKELLKELLFRVTSFRKQLSSVGPKIQNTHVTSPKTSMLILKKRFIVKSKRWIESPIQ